MVSGLFWNRTGSELALDLLLTEPSDWHAGLAPDIIPPGPPQGGRLDAAFV